MKQHSIPLLLASGALGLALGCSSTEVDETTVYAAAVTEGGTTNLDGTRGESSRPERGDREPSADEARLHFRCELPAVRERVMQREDATSGEGRPDGRGHRGPPPGRDGPDTSTVGGHGPGHHGRGGPLAFRRLLWIYDADDSGQLDDAEREELEADLAVRCTNLQARLLANFDGDGDGVLSDDELATAREAFQAQREMRHAEALAELDTDGDAEFSHEERRAGHDLRRAALEMEFDADGSGDLDATEVAALRAHLKAVIRGEAQS